MSDSKEPAIGKPAKRRRSVGIVLLAPIWMPLSLLAWCAGIIWPMVAGGFLWGCCDSAGKTPEEMWGSGNDK